MSVESIFDESHGGFVASGHLDSRGRYVGASWFVGRTRRGQWLVLTHAGRAWRRWGAGVSWGRGGVYAEVASLDEAFARIAEYCRRTWRRAELSRRYRRAA